MKHLPLVRYLVLVLAPQVLIAAEGYQTPKTEWGLPDLQGVWNFSSNTPMQRAAAYGTRQYLTKEEVTQLQSRSTAIDQASDAAIPGTGVDEAYNDFWIGSASLGGPRLTSHIIYPDNGRLPLLQESAYRAPVGQFPERPVRNAIGVTFGTDGPKDRPLSDRCLVGFNAGPPVTPSFYNNNLQIIQNQDHVVIITEMIHDARIVPLDANTHAPAQIGLWSGDSRGYCERETLVFETRNFNGLTNSFSALGSSENKFLTEKFTRVTADGIDYEFTVDDQSTFSDKIVGLISMYNVAGLDYEYACHEGNYGMTNILRGARTAEQCHEQ